MSARMTATMATLLLLLAHGCGGKKAPAEPSTETKKPAAEVSEFEELYGPVKPEADPDNIKESTR